MPGTGLFVAADRSDCTVLSRALALHNRHRTRCHLVFAVSGHVVVVLLPGEYSGLFPSHSYLLAHFVVLCGFCPGGVDTSIF